jgi:hypothetical protein
MLSNWMIYSFIIIGLIFVLPYLGFLIERNVVIFTIIWIIIPLICSTILITKFYKKFGLRSLKFFMITTMSIVIIMSFFLFSNFNTYSKNIEDYFRLKYGELYNYSENISKIVNELSENFPDIRELEKIDYKDENGNDIFLIGHSTLSKSLYKFIEISFAVLIFLIPIYTWKVNNRIKSNYDTLKVK